LNPLERAVFALTRKVVADKKARNAFILYTGALVSLSGQKSREVNGRFL
jgi:hypothetical protein